MSVLKIDSFRFVGFCHTRGGVIKQEEGNPVNRNCVLSYFFWKGNGGPCSENVSGIFHHYEYLFKSVGLNSMPMVFSSITTADDE